MELSKTLLKALEKLHAAGGVLPERTAQALSRRGLATIRRIRGTGGSYAAEITQLGREAFECPRCDKPKGNEHWPYCSAECLDGDMRDTFGKG